MNNTLHIAFIGDLTVDKYLESGEIRLGGAALNGAIWARRLGAKASVVTAVGTDTAGREMIKRLKKEHISKTHLQIKHGNTSKVDITLSKSGEKSYGEWDPGTLTKFHLREKDIHYLQEKDAVICMAYPQFAHVLTDLSHVKKKVHDTPIIVINFGDLREFHQDLTIVESVLPYADFCVFGLENERDEALINTLRQLANTSNSTLLITLGAYGSIVYEKTTSYVQIAQQVDVVDTTGAGDAFLSAFVIAYMQKKEYASALQSGTDLATQVIRQIGAY